MKLITLSKAGYNAPSQANWCYGIWQVTILDTDREYCHGYTTKENFGGDSRFKHAIETARPDIKVIITKGTYPTPHCTGIRTMPTLDSKDFINEVLTNFTN